MCLCLYDFGETPVSHAAEGLRSCREAEVSHQSEASSAGRTDWFGSRPRAACRTRSRGAWTQRAEDGVRQQVCDAVTSEAGADMTGKPRGSSALRQRRCRLPTTRAPLDRMDPPGRLSWKLLLLLCVSAGVHWGVCRCQQEVHMQEGPLYRTQGYPLTLSCDMSTVRDPGVQHFEFVMYSVTAPSTELPIISTMDSKFAYKKYVGRVQDGSIAIQRLSNTSVLFHMKELLESDSGEFQCQTPNLQDTYSGSYAAKTKIIVIPDTLSVTSSTSGLTKTEGDSLALQCQMSTQTFQHTHLSVTWYLQGNGDAQPRPIISLDKDLTVRPGKGFEDRYLGGLLTLDKVDESTYRLAMSKLQVTDQGAVSCEGSEWIQDPDRSWYRLARKTTTVSSLQVQPLIVDPNVDSFHVRLETPKGGVREGEALQLKCTVEAQNIRERYFSVAWLKGGREVARVGPTGVASVSQEYKARDNEGEMKVVKQSDRDYVLFVKPVQLTDAGAYQCRAWKEEKGSSGVFTQGRSQDSGEVQVAITVTGECESNLVVSMPNKTVNITQGGSLQLTCRVSGAKGQVSVAWQYRGDKGSADEVIKLSRTGIMEPGELYLQRVEAGTVRMLRRTADDFTLEIANVLLTDSGVYRCTATDWVTERDGTFKNVDSKSQEASLKSRGVQAKENSTINLFCSVKRPEASLTVTWKFEPTNASNQEEIVMLRHNGGITWFKEHHNYQLRVEAQAEETSFILQVTRATVSEAGTYQCVVEAFLQKVQVALKHSNKLRVIISRRESSLSIAAGPESSLEKDANSEVLMECRILKATSDLSRFAVSWQLQRPGEKRHTVVSVDRDSVLSKPGPVARYSLRRREARLYELLLQRAETGDSGQYRCVVEEWLQDSHGVWYSLPQKSAALELRRIHFYRPALDTFSLAIRKVGAEDGGEYSCTVAEYQTDCKGSLVYSTSSTSGVTSVRVLLPESKLRVQKKNHTVTASGRQGDGFTVGCQIVSQSNDNSVFDVTWWHQKSVSGKGSAYPIFRVQRDFTLHKLDHTRHGLVFERPQAKVYMLTVTDAELSDRGQYYCWVEEWLLTPRSTWRKMAEDLSGSLTVLTETESREELPLLAPPRSASVLLVSEKPAAASLRNILTTTEHSVRPASIQNLFFRLFRVSASL
ncbi:immunoglobulin superfamily member 3-like [Arapaima gigas]